MNWNNGLVFLACISGIATFIFLCVWGCQALENEPTKLGQTFFFVSLTVLLVTGFLATSGVGK